MPTPVLATKLFPPTPRSALVARPRLADRLDSTLHLGHRLTLVSAPAGFGKSTLLSDWAARHERVAWLSLDEADNALPRFMAHLGAALAGVGLDVNPDALAAAPSDAALTVIVNGLANAGRQRPGSSWLLVLDDYHVIEAPEIHEAMAFLIEHMPDSMHLLVATRSDPPFPLSRLRTRNQLTEVRAADLRFAPAEAQEFLNVVMGLQLTEDDVKALDQRTEAGSPGCSWRRSPCAACRSTTRSPTSSGPSPAATASSSTTWSTRCWLARATMCGTSCCVPRFWID